MEILLIGNGFDLEHNLPTSYQDFLDFCKRAKCIYTLHSNISLDKYRQSNLKEWNTDIYIKKLLEDAYDKRECKIMSGKEIFTTPHVALNELFTHIKCNTWLKYFDQCSNDLGKNWIDFESEISSVIQGLDDARFHLETSGSVMNAEMNTSKRLIAIWKASKRSWQDALSGIKAIDNFAAFLDTELEVFIRALEIYIAEIVDNITVTKKNADIENVTPDHIISFNYSNTYERVYGKGKTIEYDFIHGKADINKNKATCNLVLGIDEYLNDDCKNIKLNFLTFKKFYQRIYKSTGNKYLDWVDEIKDNYENYLKKESDTYVGKRDSYKKNISIQKRICENIKDMNSHIHTLYIFGHSLDVTDRDVLKLLICNDNVQTKIFYHRVEEDDKTQLGKLIKNLIHIMGQDELLRRTGGAHRTIEFIPQVLCKKSDL